MRLGQEQVIPVGDTFFRVQIRRQVIVEYDAPRLVVVSFMPNETAWEILRLCLLSIQRYTPEPHELWVVDNGSPQVFADRLLAWPDINVVLNLSRPMPKRSLKQLFLRTDPPFSGSYANGVALELAASVIDPDTRYMMTLHMDTVVCRSGWLSYLLGRLSGNVRCVGFRIDEVRQRAVHVLGMLFDLPLVWKLNLSFMHDMPRYDAGDAVSIGLRNAGYDIWACRNTIKDPDLAELLPEGSPYRRIMVDRALNDENDVIFMHLGRGVLKSEGHIASGKTSPEEWLSFGRQFICREPA